MDKRVKLTVEQKEEIFNLYATGNYSLNGLAKIYNVSKRTIHFIVKPEKLEEQKLLYIERRKDKRYYDREKHNEHVKAHRRYKNELLKNGHIE